MSPKPPVHYGDYLQLPKILDAQTLESAKRGAAAHDEMLFIVIHQTYELWFKQILHEIDSVRDLLSAKPVPSTSFSTIVARLQRVTEIQKILVDQIRVIETMTTLDFLDFRDDLIPASGFQSLQFRLIETALGVTSAHRMEVEKQFFMSRLKPEHRQMLADAEARPSLFTLLEGWLERMPFAQFDDWDFWSQYAQKVQEMLARDTASIEGNPNLDERVRMMELANLKTTRETFLTLLDARRWEEARAQGKVRLSQRATLNAIFIQLYRDWPAMQAPKQLLTLTVEMDQQMTTWRWRHAIMVQRILGTKIGTGGSAGSDYLKNTTERNRVFTDLFNLSTFLIPRAEIPALPDFLQFEMGFSYEGL
jgi:tryptophan 2,3-dioxygenase